MPPASLKYKFPSFEPIKQSQPDWFPNQRAFKVQQKEESESPQTSKRFITYGIPIYPHVMLIFKTLTLNRLYMVGCFFFPPFSKKSRREMWAGPASSQMVLQKRAILGIKMNCWWVQRKDHKRLHPQGLPAAGWSGPRGKCVCLPTENSVPVQARGNEWQRLARGTELQRLW